MMHKNTFPVETCQNVRILLSSCHNSFHHLSFSLFLSFSLTELLSPQLRFCHLSNSCMSLIIKALKETTGDWQNKHRTYSFCIIEAATEACRKPSDLMFASYLPEIGPSAFAGQVALQISIFVLFQLFLCIGIFVLAFGICVFRVFRVFVLFGLLTSQLSGH